MTVIGVGGEVVIYIVLPLALLHSAPIASAITLIRTVSAVHTRHICVVLKRRRSKHTLQSLTPLIASVPYPD